ncbi:predicted protein [Plenodomus lingam JN3]|uniref:Predicted protein n=1 Tax=Leptosphaeria maculans (strain JN3 / isolate v23.1.3 / race Av1-4-5-6-7-8) TaxID=985895 RepID=E5AAC5_LEPMJ|nr:predicted protein [Plenodomus lingam JN3]CBY00616.1 predicted protein [Plenodomus lingam JN3]
MEGGATPTLARSALRNGESYRPMKSVERLIEIW